jgi:hypothetical protein
MTITFYAKSIKMDVGFHMLGLLLKGAVTIKGKME